MDNPRAIAKLNVDHFRQLLETETDPARREAIAKLLAEHEAKLAEIERRERL